MAASSVLYALAPATHADIVVDNFPTSSVPDRVIEQSGPGMNVDTEGGLPPAQVIGGTRQTTVSVTAGPGTARAIITNGNPGTLEYSSSGVLAKLTLLYNAGGVPGGLAANIAPFLGVAIPFADVALGAATELPVTVTLTDGSGGVATATKDVTSEGAQVLQLPTNEPGLWSGLGSLDTTDIESIELTFDANSGQEFTLTGPILLLTPEPLAILGWGVVLVLGLAGWRFFGGRLNAAA